MAALKQGWRLVEVALGEAYSQGVAEAVAEALRRSGVPRKEVTIQGTLAWQEEFLAADAGGASDDDGGPVRRPVLAALAALGVDHLDLVVLRQRGAPVPTRSWQKPWEELEALVADGKVRQLGVGNVIAEQLPEILKVAVKKVKPVVLLSKLSIYFPANHVESVPGPRGCLLEGASQHRLHLQGYGLVDADPGIMSPMVDAHVAAVARRHMRTPWQVLVRWALQLGAVVLVDTTVGAAALREAAEVFGFTLPTGDVRLLTGVATLYASGAPTKRASAACVDDVYQVRGALFSPAQQ